MPSVIDESPPTGQLRPSFAKAMEGAAELGRNRCGSRHRPGSRRTSAPLLFKTSARHPLVLTAAVVLLLSATAITAFVPALRAARIDPGTALRD